MKTINLVGRALMVLLIVAFHPDPAHAQQKPIEFPEVEIGIVERLNDTIPLDLHFANEQNDTVTLRQLINKPTILSFVYFDCPSICGPFQFGIADMLSKMDMKLGEEFQVITISFNPADTPEKGIQKKVNYTTEIPEELRKHWMYLTGNQEEIHAITNAVGYRYKPVGFDFAHPSAIVVLSPAGKITRYLYGTSFLPFDTKMALIEAQKGLARPTINKILELCFAYDPESRGYTLQITRVVGAFTLIIALIVFVTLIIRGKKRKKD